MCLEPAPRSIGGTSREVEYIQDRLRISEMFVSSQGEGALTGMPSVFIRCSGCNLRCWFCDTPYASWQPDGDLCSVDEIVRLTIATGLSHVVLTGGEPLLSPLIVPLCQHLRKAALHITIETAGTVFQSVSCDLMSLSPKLSSSQPSRGTISDSWVARHQATRWRPEVIRQLINTSADYQLKFVIDTPEDCDEVSQLLQELAPFDPEHVWLMPQGRQVTEIDVKLRWLAPWAETHGYRLSDRHHLRWYGDRRGT